MNDDDPLVALALAIQQAAGALVALLRGAAPSGCAHQRRRDLTAFGGGEHWVCLDCGYEHEESDDGEKTGDTGR